MFFKPTFGGDLVGSGELKLSNGVINSWMRYITGDGKSINKPNDFFVTTDGEYSSYWYCPHGQCQPTKKRNAIKQCEERFERECRHFARRRNVVWKNGINTGKLKTSNFNSKMTRTEVIAKFTTLGFIGDRTSSSTATSTTTSTLKKKGRITFNKCTAYANETDYHDTFTVSLKKNKVYQKFFAKGEIYPITLSIIRNDDSEIETKIRKWGTKKNQFDNYIFNKETNELYEIQYKDKKGKDLVSKKKLICEDVVGNWKNQKTKVTKKKKEVNMSSGVVENLEKLKSLLDEGILTEEEFNAAKKKLLN